MSLLGRLEDLSLTDIVQIVFLSRRTGILEIINDEGRHTVLFKNGMIVNASSPSSPTLAHHLIASGAVPPEMGATLSEAEETGVPAGNAVLEINILTPEELAAAVRQRVVSCVTPLLSSKDGEFNFILSDSVGVLEIEYDPERVFREGGIAPQQILGTDGEKLKPLGGLEESMRAGKALLRGSAPPPSPPSLDLPLAPIDEIVEERVHVPKPGPMPSEPAFLELDEPFSDAESAEPLFPEASAAEQEHEPGLDELLDSRELDAEKVSLSAPLPEIGPAPAGEDTQPPQAKRQEATRFRVGTQADGGAEPLLGEWDVVVFERDPLVRVAVKRAFARRGVQIHQYSTADDAKRAMLERLSANQFFVTFLDFQESTSAGSDAIHLLQTVKRKNHHLPIVIVDREADLHRRQAILASGADMYLTKPSAAHMQPSLVEQQLALFADELFVFAERTYAHLRSLGGGRISSEGARRSYELADQERVNRSYAVLRQLINELTNPNDLSQVVDTIARTAEEYLDRGVLFEARDEGFAGLGGFGSAGVAGELNVVVRQLRIARGTASVIEEVEKAARLHRGKMKKSQGNVELLACLGDLLPTEVAVFPLVHAGKTIAVMYCDNAEQRVPIGDVSGLEIFLYQAGFALQNAFTASSQRRPV